MTSVPFKRFYQLFCPLTLILKNTEVESDKEVDTIFTYITSKLINKVSDAIFVSGVSQKDHFKIKKEIAYRETNKPQNIALDPSVFTAQYCILNIPKDDRFAYLSLHGQDIKFAKKSGKVPYYGDSFNENTIAIYGDKRSNSILKMTFTIDNIKFELDESGKTFTIGLMPIVGTD